MRQVRPKHDLTRSAPAYTPARADDAITLTATEQLSMLKRRWWLLLIVPLLTAAVAYQISEYRGPTYTATATLLVSHQDLSGTESLSAITAANALTKTYTRLVLSPPILERVLARLSLQQTPADLASRLRVKADADTQVITIAAARSDPQSAARVANAVAEEFVAWLEEVETSRLNQSKNAIKQVVDKTRAELDALSDRLSLLRDLPRAGTAAEQEKIANLEALRQQQQSAYSRLLERQQQLQETQLTLRHRLSIVAPARPPEEPSSLPSVIYAAGALLLGLFAAAMGIVLFDRARPSEASRSESGVQHPSLPAAISLLPPCATRPQTSPDAEANRAMYSFRTIREVTLSCPTTATIAVASLGQNTSHSVAAVDLAVALAHLGRRVALVDGRLCHPSNQGIFGALTLPGLSDLPAPSEWARTSLTWRLHQVEKVMISSAIAGLWLIPAGTSRPSTLQSASQERLREVLRTVRQIADVIVIDVPPLTECTEAMLLTFAADHAVLVTEPGRARMHMLASAVANIRGNGLVLLGVVLYPPPGAESLLRASTTLPVDTRRLLNLR